RRAARVARARSAVARRGRPARAPARGPRRRPAWSSDPALARSSFDLLSRGSSADQQILADPSAELAGGQANAALDRVGAQLGDLGDLGDRVAERVVEDQRLGLLDRQFGQVLAEAAGQLL